MSCCQNAQGTNTCATTETRGVSKTTFRPNADIYETPEAFVVRADVPGARADAIDLRYEDGVLTLKAPVAARMHEGARAVTREYGVGGFERAFRVGEGIDAQAIGAELKDGVLTLTLPKAAAVKPRSIRVQTA